MPTTHTSATLACIPKPCDQTNGRTKHEVNARVAAADHARATVERVAAEEARTRAEIAVARERSRTAAAQEARYAAEMAAAERVGRAGGRFSRSSSWSPYDSPYNGQYKGRSVAEQLAAGRQRGEESRRLLAAERERRQVSGEGKWKEES